MNKIEMQQRLNTIQKEAEQIKKALEKSYPSIQEAKPGDLLEDGTVVIAKYNNAALIAAPQSTEVRCQWSEEFNPVFESLKDHGLNPSQWFVPSKNQLFLAYKNANQHFSSSGHWSSDESWSTTGYAWYFFFAIGFHYPSSKEVPFCVRAFRLVEL
jgi:hypothetical protein